MAKENDQSTLSIRKKEPKTAKQAITVNQKWIKYLKLRMSMGSKNQNWALEKW